MSNDKHVDVVFEDEARNMRFDLMVAMEVSPPKFRWLIIRCVTFAHPGFPFPIDCTPLFMCRKQFEDFLKDTHLPAIEALAIDALGAEERQRIAAVEYAYGGVGIA